jgi:hypothetical protein
MNANMHWSLGKEAHDKIAHNIDPVLNEKYFWVYFIRQYILAPFNSKLSSDSMRLARKEKEENIQVNRSKQLVDEVA